MIGKSIRWVAGLAVTAVVVVMMGVLLVPRAFGLTPYVVTSGSMRPTFEPGSVVLTKDVPQEEVRVGDIVTFQTPHGVTTHRVVQRYTAQDEQGAAQYFKTQGDANDIRDKEPINSRNVLGEVRFAVAGVGYVVQAMTAPMGIIALVALFAVVLFTGNGQRSADPSDEVTDEGHERDEPKLTVVR